MCRWMFLAPLCLLLAACGGGDGTSFADTSSSSGSSTSSSSSGSSSSGSSSSSSSSGSSSSGSSTSSGSSSGTSGAAFWLPYQATPIAGSTSGQTGIFVVPSNALASAPAYVSRSARTKFLAASFRTTLSASHIVTAYSPALYLFAATDTSGNIHLYELDLAVGTTPAPTQLGTLSLPLATGAAINTVICDSNFAMTNLTTANSLFVVLHIAGSAGCGSSSDAWILVRASDAVTAAPASLPIATTQFTPLYSPLGALTGLVLRDPNTNNLFLYPDSTFSTPVAAIAAGGVSSSAAVYDNTINANEPFIGTDLFLSVHINGIDALYQLNYNATSATLVYTAAGELSAGGVADDNNLYFSDVLTNTSTTQTIWQTPLAGGAPTELYSYLVPATGTATGTPYQLVGSDNTNLVLLTNSTNTTANTITGALATLPVGSNSGSTVPLGSSLNGLSTAFMLPTVPGTRSSDLVFVDAVNVAPAAAYVYSSELLTPENVVKQSQLPNSYYLTDGLGALSGTVLQLTNINPAIPGLGGGPVNAVTLSTLAVTPLKGSSGTVYTLPGGIDPFFIGLSNTIGAGEITAQAPTTGNGVGIAYDLSQHLIVPIAIANTDVSVF